MSQVIRFFHLRDPSWMDTTHKGGATVRVVGDPERVGQVDVQFVQCSRKDPFCKKTGRSFAEAAPIKVVPLRYLPNELARIHNTAFQNKRLRHTANANDYEFAMKYFLPKE